VLPEPSDVPQTLTLFHKIRELSKDLAIYGIGDVAIQIVNFLLLRVYVLYLSKEEYGILALLGGVEAVAKLFFRWGVDGAFMRFWYDCEDLPDKQRLASTLFFFLLVVNGVLFVAAVIAVPLVPGTFGLSGFTSALQLVLLNTFAIGFTFIPFHVLRMEQRSREFSLLTFARSAATMGLRIVLVVGFGLGVMGVVVADVVVTSALLAVLIRRFAPLIRPVFSGNVLKASLAFGLPRLPHGFAQQVIAVADKFVLTLFRPMAEVGLYSIGVSVGLIQKLFLSAFEYAWAPFYYATVREHDAPRVFATITTYGVAVLALLTAGLSAIAADLLDIVTRGQYVAAAGVVAWTALGVLFQGVYLLTSIGLNITRRTHLYPVATISAAALNVGLNFALIPRYGIMGAAWANGAAYAAQAGIAYRLSARCYPIRYETGRLARIAGAALLAYLAGRGLPDMPSLVGLVARGATVIVVMCGVLWFAGFLRPEELRGLAAIARRPKPGLHPPAPSETTELAGAIVAAELPDDQPVSEQPERAR
jgi:O-antigen/teichoic acid export membrane protein